ncbi:MAG: hypothetical protein ACOCWG_06035 [bacterium]
MKSTLHTGNIGFLGIFFWLSLGNAIYCQREYPPCEAFINRDNDTILVNTSYSNTFYLGIDNIFKINKPVFKDSVYVDSVFTGFKYQDSISQSLELSTNNGKILKDNGYYYIIPKTQGLATVYLKDKNNKKIIHEKEFPVKKLPSLKVTMCDLILNDVKTINRLFLLACDSIGVYYTDDLVDSQKWLTITRFSIGYNYGNYFIEYASRNNRYTSQMISGIKKISPGNMLRINITCENKTGFKIVIPTISIKVY